MWKPTENEELWSEGNIKLAVLFSDLTSVWHCCPQHLEHCGGKKKQYQSASGLSCFFASPSQWWSSSELYNWTNFIFYLQPAFRYNQQRIWHLFSFICIQYLDLSSSFWTGWQPKHFQHTVNIESLLCFLCHTWRVQTDYPQFITSQLKYFNSLYWFQSSQPCFNRSRMLQPGRFLTQTENHEHISPELASLHWLPVCFWNWF